MFNPITVDNFAALFYCMPMDRASDSMMKDLKIFILIGWDWNSFDYCLVYRFPVVLFGSPGISNCHTTRCNNSLYFLSIRLCFFILLNHDSFVYRDHSLTSKKLEGYHANRTTN